MAFPSTLEWDVQTGGSDNNGGAFDTASSGTDGSQSTTPIASYTDVVIGATTTQGTSIIRPFVSTDVGNVLNFQSGTGFTVQRAEIASVSAGIATFDKTLGTTGSTGGTGILGGCLATTRPAFLAAAPATAGNKIHIKSGTYTQTTNNTISGLLGTQNLPITIIGYGVTHNDMGTKPVLTTATNNINIFNITNAGWLYWKNISFTCTAATKGSGIIGITTSSLGWGVSDCVFDGFAIGVDSSTNARGPTSLYLAKNAFKNCTNAGVGDSVSAVYVTLIANVFYNCTNAGYRLLATNSQNPGLFASNIFAKCGTGLTDTNTTRALNWTIIDNTFVDCTTAGLNISETTTSVALILKGNIFYNCVTGATFAFSGGVDKSTIYNGFNAYGANTTNRTGLSAGVSDVTLTADPFNNRTTPDYGLNANAGGGAALRTANYPGVLNIGGTGYLDIGALQHQTPTVANTFA